MSAKVLSLVPEGVLVQISPAQRIGRVKTKYGELCLGSHPE